MDNKDKQQESVNDRTANDVDRSDTDPDGSSSGNSRRGVRSGDEFGLAERLTNILVEDGDSDLLLQHSDREDNVLQWLQALDMQVMGACRADERLKPLLKLNVSNGVAEDRLLVHLSQHFEPSEVAMLARFLCIPLVSIRVGKINKQGTCLCPTSTKGNLTLTLLPTSNLRLSFIGDDGQIERLTTLSSGSSGSSVEIEAISADQSGRSFVMRIESCEDFYFWCSEKSKLLGDELIDKLNDLLIERPSLTKLTGISETRLGCFATHHRAYLGGSTQNQTSSVIQATYSDMLESHLPTSSTRHSRSRQYGNQGGKPNSFYMGSLSPRSSSFKDGLPRTLLVSKTASRDKFKRRVESHHSLVDDLSAATQSNSEEKRTSKKDNRTEVEGSLSSLASSLLDSIGKSSNLPSLTSSASQGPSLGSSFISPYYCWCPPVASTLQYAVAPFQLPISSTESFSLPPLSSLLSTSMPSSLLAQSSLEFSEIPSLDFPPFLPEPLVRLPLSMASSQQIATFTPLMCEPIVHIPVIDICSSEPCYLVSAGPAISTTIPSLHPALVNPLVPASDSMMENSARETLRLLISSSNQNNPQLMSVLPSVLNNNTEGRTVLTTHRRGLYEGTNDVGAIANSIGAMSLVSMSEMSTGSSSVLKKCLSQSDMVDNLDKQGGGGSGGTCLDEGLEGEG